MSRLISNLNIILFGTLATPQILICIQYMPVVFNSNLYTSNLFFTSELHYASIYSYQVKYNLFRNTWPEKWAVALMSPWGICCSFEMNPIFPIYLDQIFLLCQVEFFLQGMGDPLDTDHVSHGKEKGCQHCVCYTIHTMLHRVNSFDPHNNLQGKYVCHIWLTCTYTFSSQRRWLSRIQNLFQLQTRQ